MLHKQLGAAGFAKQDLLVEQRGRMKDLRTLSTSMLARVRQIRGEVSDTAFVTAYTELISDLRSMAVPAMPVAAGGAVLAVEVLEAPVSTAADLSVSLDATSVLAAIGSMGAVHVRRGMLVLLVFILLVDTCVWLHTNAINAFLCMCAQAAGQFHLDGVFLREIKSCWNGMVFSPDGQFLVVSQHPTNSVQVLRASDQLLVRSIGLVALKDPRRVAISPDGTTVFVSDYELHAVLQYRMDGTLVRRIGSKGQAAGQFDQPQGLAVSKAGELFVADQKNNRVQVFRLSDGTFLRQIGGAQGSGKGQFYVPMDVTLSPDETELLVVDFGNDRIQVFGTQDGQYLRGWGSQGSADGQLLNPICVVVTGGGEVLVADMDNHRVCVFDLDGTFRRSMGVHGSGPGQFELPFLLAASPTSRELCVGQMGLRVQFFR